MKIIPIKLLPMAQLIANKRGSDKEVLLILFEKCNLSCSFCHQDHTSLKGTNDIVSKADAVIAAYNGVDKYAVNITGGEIFLDQFPDSMFDDYYKLAVKVGKAIKDHEVTFVSNLIFRHPERVEALLKDVRDAGINVSLATSYDPCGRFSASGKHLFFENLKRFQPWIKNISMVITKQNAQWYIDRKNDPVFEFLYDRFPVYLDHYTPGPNFDLYQPTDRQIADMYIALNDRYPNVQPLKGWRENAQNKTTCRSTAVVTPEGQITTCRSLIAIDQVLDKDQGEKIKQEVEGKFLEKYGCLSCEHYQRCGLRCFLHSEFLDDNVVECHFKRMFDNILA